MGELVSVVLPVYNREKTIKNAIESVLNQSYSQLELIVIDDNSTDQTGHIVRSFTDSRLTYLSNPVNKGANYSRNRGIWLAKGGWVAFNDSDDVWHEDKLARQMESISQNNSADVAFSNYNYHCQNGDIKTCIPRELDIDYMEEDIYDTLLHRNVVGTPTLLVKKACLMELGGFDESMPRFQDWELCLRLAEKYQFDYVPEPLVEAFDTGRGISNDMSGYIIGLLNIVKKHEKELRHAGQLGSKLADIIQKSVNMNLDYVKENLGDALFYEAVEALSKKEIAEKNKFVFVSNLADCALSGKNIFSKLHMYSNKKIGIYGYGYIGKVLFRELDRGGFPPVFVVDQFPGTGLPPVPVYSLKKVLRNGYMDKIDVIIVTLLDEDDILKCKLRDMTGREVVGVQELCSNKDNKGGLRSI